ncbi:hypothetical protein [Streptomyces malaysiensis]|uniref:hypothetical protein n=1 Tax=Streptomyces malaysiensis TaxID=92644 RepID=UPI0037101B08
MLIAAVPRRRAPAWPWSMVLAVLVHLVGCAHGPLPSGAGRVDALPVQAVQAVQGVQAVQLAQAMQTMQAVLPVQAVQAAQTAQAVRAVQSVSGSRPSPGAPQLAAGHGACERHHGGARACVGVDEPAVGQVTSGQVSLAQSAALVSVAGERVAPVRGPPYGVAAGSGAGRARAVLQVWRT